MDAYFAALYYKQQNIIKNSLRNLLIQLKRNLKL